MSKFTSNFKGELIGKNLWKNLETFEYHVGEYPSEEIITVPEGFITDFASVPRIFWLVISPVDKHGKAAVIHDYCYYYTPYSRKVADLIFSEALKVLHVKPWKVFCMYHGVRIGAGYAWWKHRRREKKERLK
jgi:hypothetical protein